MTNLSDLGYPKGKTLPSLGFIVYEYDGVLFRFSYKGVVNGYVEPIACPFLHAAGN